jgi:hypothetical protein
MQRSQQSECATCFSRRQSADGSLLILSAWVACGRWRQEGKKKSARGGSRLSAAPGGLCENQGEDKERENLTVMNGIELNAGEPRSIEVRLRARITNASDSEYAL